ncbi:MAG: NHLP family bacteriocin export ABC transporter peptidase/permease/ATPase subunit [Lachnospiraceae bacterium]|nr:NHLP family bacteriocin export ABC transporter peptidase/permease/ATPase subunit [Lachnospiraceae bacterium]
MNRNYAKTPTVFQMETTECGAASLAMIMGYYGRTVPLEQMRIETGVSRDGCSAKNLILAAQKFGLEAHGYRKDLEGLLTMPVPAIIHWNFNHFVVWEGRRGKYCYINDPNTGRRRMTVEDLDVCFTGIVLTFKPAGAFEKTKNKNTLFSFAAKRLTGQYRALAALVITGLFLVIPGLLTPVFTQVFIDDIFLSGNFDWLGTLIAVMAGTVLLQAFLTFYRGRLLLLLQRKLTLLSTHGMLTHMFRLPANFFEQRYAGDLSQRVTNNKNVSEFLTGDLAQTALNCFTAVFYLILLMLYSPLLTLIGVVCIFAELLLMYVMSGRMKEYSQKTQQETGKLTGNLFSGLSITSTLKAAGTENAFVGRLLGNYAVCITLQEEMGARQELINAIPEVFEKLLMILSLTVGGLQIIKGNMTAGMLIGYTGLLTAFVTPINELTAFLQRIQTAKADMARVEDIMRYQEDARYEVADYADGADGKLDGKVELKNVSFGYNLLEPPLVTDFSFMLPAGSSIAFVGASGSGKSTVSKICSGLYAPWNGQVLVDGIPMKKIKPEVIAASVATVSQNITLFSGTVRENLTLWNRYIDDDDMIRAAKDACIHDDINAKPGAYDFMLTENGTNLSGGQRQRLEIARALILSPSVLIMDEATSALDPIVEKQILDNIKRRGCTCIIVAHRLSAIRDCDEILVMDGGKIIQRGTHEELAGVPGHYQRLIRNI